MTDPMHSHKILTTKWHPGILGTMGENNLIVWSVNVLKVIWKERVNDQIVWLVLEN
jgi:hypothetical protein